MKYLFFFNGQPLLLCCVCCKIAIQDFVTGLHKKNKKNLRFHRRVHWRTITLRYFTESWKTFTGLCHFHRRTIPVGISQRVEKNLLDCATIIDGPYPLVFHRELKKIYGIVPLSPTGAPTALPMYNTDGITDEFTHIPKRTHVRHVSVCTNTYGFSDGSKSLAGFSNFFGAHFN